MKTVTPYLANLTPLRGIAALLTVIFHVDLMLGLGGNLLLKFEDSWLINRMYLMVDFFFILSGFVMSHVYGKWFQDSVERSEFKRFTIARFARVYPLHFVSLLATVTIFGVSGWIGIPENLIMEANNNLYSFITNLFLLQAMNLHDWFSWTHAAWSISVEWWMYMLFPFLVKPFMNLKPVGRIAVVLACFGGYLVLTFLIIPNLPAPVALPFFKPDPLNNTVNAAVQYGFLRCLCGFVLGMMMYLGYRENWGKSWLANGFTLVLLSAGLFTCMHFALADVFSISFLPLILLSAAYGSPSTDRFLGTKLLQRLGDWSFSIYLVHQPLMFLFGNAFAYYQFSRNGTYGQPSKPDQFVGWLVCLAFIAVTLAVSALTYRWVEVPARNYINRQFGGRKTVYSVDPSATTA
ncbi:acyltransferase family protein [Larkinella terrae]|uniref:Acyltransferase family protein n=1 Tax=Larkinella terrae TaxID=2025311 RepID=A0A7K0EJV5_9BACT|nr:acyltransferase [Larkinella terrae]MRS62143.1 acyltransferase family protein [Larkinella terrae]